MSLGRLLTVVAVFSVALVFACGVGGAAQGDKKDELILKKTVSAWIKALGEEKDPKVRRIALLALEASNTASRAGLPAVLNAAEKDDDVLVRRDAVKLLGRLGPETRGALKGIMAALQTDKAEAVREAAATALGNDKFVKPAQEYIKELAAALKDPDAGTRSAIASTLRKMGEYALPAIPAIIEAAQNKKEAALVRTEAIVIISRHARENPQTVPLLVVILLDEEGALPVRTAAAEGLGRAGGDTADAVAALGKMLSAKNVELRKSAAVALGTLGTRSASSWPAVKERLTGTAEPDGSIRNHLIRLAGALAKEKSDAIALLTTLAVKDDVTENRIAAIQELGELGALAKESLPALSNLAAQDSRLAVREAAAAAVKQIKR